MKPFLRLLIALGIMLAGTAAVAYAALPSTEFDWRALADAYQYADLSLSKYIVDGHPVPGEELVYQLYFQVSSFNSTTSAENVLLTDVLPAEVEFVDWYGYGYLDGVQGDLNGRVEPHIAGNQISWNLGTQDPGTTGYINVTVRVPDTASPGTVITNNAVITSSTTDPNLGNNEDSLDSTLIPPAVDVSVDKSLESFIGGPGTQMIYRLEFDNGSSAVSTARSGVLTDTLPTGISLVSWKGWLYHGYSMTPYVYLHETISATVAGDNVVWNLPDLLSGDRGSIIARVLVSDTLSVGDVVTNTLSISNEVPDTNPGNNVDELETTLVQPITDISLVKGPSGVVLTDEFEYWLHYTSEANLSVDGIVLTDTLPTEVTFLSSRGLLCQDYNCEPMDEALTPTVTGQDLRWVLPGLDPEDEGWVYVRVAVSETVGVGDTITNKAGVLSPGEDANPVDNVVVLDTVMLEPIADLRVTKGLISYPPVPGGEMKYELRFENQHSTANAPAQNVVLADTLPAEATYVSSSGFTARSVDGKPVYAGLPEAGTPTVSGQLVVWTLPQLDEFVDAYIYVRVRVTDTVSVGDVITNNVEIATTTTEADPSDNADTLAITIGTPIIDMDIHKHLLGSAAGPGGEMAFSIRCENDGNDTAHDVVVTDTLPITLSMVSWTGTLLADDQLDLTEVITPEVQGNQVIWRLGDLPGLSTVYLYPRVAVSTTAQAGDSLTNTAAISTSSDDVSPFDNEVSVMVTLGEPIGDLVLGKWANRVLSPGDPTSLLESQIPETLIRWEPVVPASPEARQSWPELSPYEVSAHPLRPDVGSAEPALDFGNGDPDLMDAVLRGLETSTGYVQFVQPNANGAEVTEVPVGSDLEYGISICNEGYAEVRGVVVTDTLPSATTFVSWTGSGYSTPVTLTVGGDDLVWETGTIAESGCIYLYPRVHVPGTVGDGTHLLNTVSCASSDEELSLTNNDASVSVTAVASERYVFLPLVVRQ